jgi:outer membrane protein assembly factor BamB
MKKNVSVLLITIILLFTSCLDDTKQLYKVELLVQKEIVENSFDLKQLITNNWIKIEDLKTIHLETITKIPNKKFLNRWDALIFSGKGDLVNLWKYDKGMRGRGVHIGVYPKFWHILGSYYSEKLGNSPISGFYDPEKGNLELTTDFLTGPTDGEYVFCDRATQQVEIRCWDIKRRNEVWKLSLPTKPSGEFFIQYGSLLHISDSLPDSCFVSKINPWTGEILWRIKTKGNITSKSFRNNMLYMIVSEEQKKNYLYSVDINDSTVKSFELPIINPQMLSKIEQNIFITSSNGYLYKYDVNEYKAVCKYNLNSDIGISKINNKILVFSTQSEKYSLFDPTTETITPLDTSSATVINNSLIFKDEMQIRGINPETLETIWWIDLDENIENANVEWLDWRGVLVVSNNEIACYSTKK